MVGTYQNELVLLWPCLDFVEIRNPEFPVFPDFVAITVEEENRVSGQGQEAVLEPGTLVTAGKKLIGLKIEKKNKAIRFNLGA